ncbi:MAG: NAD(P)/FAD-dependent oxidoreductase [bacterium]
MVTCITIIGAGPAGIAAAIQLQRYGLHPLLLERDQVGGLLRNAHWVENYPGFPHGISGPDLATLFALQLAGFGIQAHHEEVQILEFNSGVFHIVTDQRRLESQYVVIASGTKPKLWTDLAVEDSVRERIFCEVFPLLDVSDKRVAIIGASDAAFDYALNLAHKNRVFILNRSTEVRCLPLLWERVVRDENVAYQPEVSVTAVENRDSGLRLRCSSQLNSELDVDYLLIAIGREPNLDYVSENLRLRWDELIRAKRLYRIGDADNGSFRQTAICVGDGVRAAMEIYHHWSALANRSENRNR